jgi:hypothetical protein
VTYLKETIMSPDSLRKVFSYLSAIVIFSTLLAAVQAALGTPGERTMSLILISFSVGVLASMAVAWLHKPEAREVYLTPEQVADIQERLNAVEEPQIEVEEDDTSTTCVGFAGPTEETEEEDECQDGRKHRKTRRVNTYRETVLRHLL